MAIVTISRQFGAGGRTLGESIANKLNYRFVSEVILDKMAEEANVSIEWIRSVEKHAGDWLMRFMSKLVKTDFIDRHVGESKSDFDEVKYKNFLESIVPELAEKDNVVILGRGSQFILQNHPKALNFLLLADMEDRIKFIENLWNVSRSDAEKTIRARQKTRNNFLKLFDERSPNDPSLYHLSINMSKISLERAEEILLFVIRKKEEDFQE